MMVSSALAEDTRKIGTKPQHRQYHIVDLVIFSPSYFITDKLYHINLYLVYLRHERNSNFSDGRDWLKINKINEYINPSNVSKQRNRKLYNPEVKNSTITFLPASKAVEGAYDAIPI
jgi:hypothetical protein